MERVGKRERFSVISELTQGRELANELKRQLLSPRESCNNLLEKILCSYDNALTMLDFLRTPISSTTSVGPDPVYEDHPHKHVSKKRKLLARKSKQVVRVSSETGSGGFDAQLSDGYNWRKFGQKAILGAINPRSYYRCTHRHTQGCYATKQVQQSDQDPSIFEVSYQGVHNCIQERMKQDNTQKKEEPMTTTNELCVKVETQEVDCKDGNASSFSTPIGSGINETHFITDDANNLAETSYLTPFSPPATPESYFSMSPNDFDFAPHFQNIPGAELPEIISTPTPITNFTFGDFDVLFDQPGFDSSFLDSFDCFS